jgi:alpha-mannosidase
LITLVRAAEPGMTPLWEIGQPDRGNAEFALAPGDYGRYGDDGFFVVGASDPQRDWPYVHPGPADNWAGSRRHTFLIVFGLSAVPAEGNCRLRFDLVDTQSGVPPTWRVEVNGTAFERSLPPGAGDASVFGRPEQGKPVDWEIVFPSSVLRRGDNEIAITSQSGSWALYDAVKLETPAGARLGAVEPGLRISAVDAPPVWVKAEGEARQPVTVSLRSSGELGEVVFLFAGKEVKRSAVRAGVQTVELALPAVNAATSGRLEVKRGDRVLAAREVTMRPPRLRELWMLPHSHVDIGYTHLQDEVIGIQITNLLKGMELARASAGNPDGMRFKWNPEAVWVLEHFLARATPAQQAEFVEAVRRGDVGVDGLYANMLTGLCRPEELAQCLWYGARMVDLTGVPVETAAICDVPGWTWGLTTMMGQAGIKYFAIGPNYSARIGTIHQWANRPFYWQSPSGREKVLCYVVDNYHFLGDLEANVRRHSERLERADYPYDLAPMFWVGTWPGGGVDNAPPDEELVAKVKAWNEKYAAPRVIISLAGEFFREFERRHGAELEAFAGDLTPYWEDGAGSTSRETAMNRASAERLVQAEMLQALLAPADRNAGGVELAWKNVLLYSEHTWGAHNSISEPDAPFVVDQWQVKQAFALDADRQSRALLEAALESQRAPADATRKQTIDVFNTTQWPRTDLVVLPAATGRGFDGVLTERGRVVPAQRLASGELAFLAEDVPAFGARRFQLVERAGSTRGKARVEGLTLRTGTLEVALDGVSGAITGLRRKGVAGDFVDAEAPVGLNDFRYVLGTDAAGAQVNGPVSYQVLDAGPLVVTLRFESEAPGCRRLVREVRVIDGLDRVELVNHVDRLAVREKDSVHFGFGFLVPGGTVRMETPWAVVRPNVDQLPGACRNWFTVQRWVDVSNADRGITLAPLDAPLLQVGGITANLLGPVAWEEWLTEAIESTTLYSWAQNNHWFTNYKADQPGVTTFRYHLRPHRGGYRPIEAARFGIETSRPLMAVLADPGRPVPGSLLGLDSADVLVETVKVSEDGKALVLRLFGVSGRTVRTRLDWRGVRPSGVFGTDLTERALDRIPGKIEVPGYGVTMVRAEF